MSVYKLIYRVRTIVGKNSEGEQEYLEASGFEYFEHIESPIEAPRHVHEWIEKQNSRLRDGIGSQKKIITFEKLIQERDISQSYRKEFS